MHTHYTTDNINSTRPNETPKIAFSEYLRISLEKLMSFRGVAICLEVRISLLCASHKRLPPETNTLTCELFEKR